MIFRFGDCRTLGRRLEQWRKNCRERLEKRLEPLPDDHPLKCRISLLGTMDYGRLEVAHTRTLAWLLDPKREHGFDNALVNSMLSRLGGLTGWRAFCVDRVEAERFYKNSAKEDAGRTDVWVEGLWGEPERGKRGLIVIEAKIDACEGEEQLDRYDEEIRKWLKEHGSDNDRVCRVFLTPDGRKGTTARDWKPLSFSKLAQAFCDAANSLRTKAGYHYLRFYIASVLKDILQPPIAKSNAERDCSRYKLLSFLEKS